MALAFAHPCLVVDDLELAREFYEAMFGFRVAGEEGWADNAAADRAVGSRGSRCRGYMLAGHNCFLELFQFEAPESTGPAPRSLGAHEPGLRHLAFYVDDCAGEYRRALSLGAEPLGHLNDPAETTAAVYMRDPCGNIFELCEVAAEAERLERLPGIKQADTPRVAEEGENHD